MITTTAHRSIMRILFCIYERTLYVMSAGIMIARVHPDGTIVLDSGECRTTSTLLALNDVLSGATPAYMITASPSRSSSRWIIGKPADETTIEFYDGMVLRVHSASLLHMFVRLRDDLHVPGCTREAVNNAIKRVRARPFPPPANDIALSPKLSRLIARAKHMLDAGVTTSTEEREAVSV